MNRLVESIFQRLLTELRNIAGGAPSQDVYYAMQYLKGYVGYYELKPDEHGYVRLLSLDSGDPNGHFAAIRDNYVKEIEKNPTLKKAADELVRLGIVFIKEEKITDKKSSWTYSGKLRRLFSTPEEIPDKLQKYVYNYDKRINNVLKVDHTKKAIDLDANYRNEQTRRGDPRDNGLKSNVGPAYVIPSGTTAYENNELGLQKMLKFLMTQDARLTPDYRITGDEKYRKMTVGQLVGKPEEVQSALTGREKLVMFHGTSIARWNIIQKKGLRPGAGDVYYDQVKGWSDKNVYLTFSHSNAENYATRQAIKDGSDAAVLRVEVPDFTRLVTDEDSFDMFMPQRKYKIQKMYRNGDKMSEPEEIELGDGHDISPKVLMFWFSDNSIVMDDDAKALYKEMMSFLSSELQKKSLKNGSVAYRGFIPPKFIHLDMTYERKKFKTPERKGGPQPEEYDSIRQDVQAKAKRYDEALVKDLIRSLL